MEQDTLIVWLWEILEELQNPERVLFLRFVSGRSRLPINIADITQKFQVLKVDKVCYYVITIIAVLHHNINDITFIITLYSTHTGSERTTYLADMLFPVTYLLVLEQRDIREKAAIRHTEL